MQLALYEPDIPQNTGTILRLCACLGVAAHLIEPAGFPISDRHFRRSGMDYLDAVTIERHASFAAFDEWRRRQGLRLILFSTRAATPYLDHAFSAGRHPAVRPGIGRRAGSGPRRRRRAAGHPDAAGPALDQCGDGRGHGLGRGAAANWCGMTLPTDTASKIALSVPPQMWFVVSAIFHYLGPAFAALLFAQVGVLGVAWFRIASAAAIFAIWTKPWRLLRTAPRETLILLVLLGACLAIMNSTFYLAIARLPLEPRRHHRVSGRADPCARGRARAAQFRRGRPRRFWRLSADQAALVERPAWLRLCGRECDSVHGLHRARPSHRARRRRRRR